MISHTFAICAYKESEYLEECIHSLINQTVKSNIILATSTPNDYIKGLCEKYNIPMYVNTGESGITQDWNFAYSQTNTDYVTIAHQDDIYEKEYVSYLDKYVRDISDTIIFFTDYFEIRNGKKVYDNSLLKIKRIMLCPLRLKIFWKSRFVRRRILSLGSPICCPSVAFARNRCPENVFRHGFRAAEDWEAWERLSRKKGAFVYCRKPLTGHRIHGESETSKIIGDSARQKENYVMFRKFWPAFIAKPLNRLYSKSEKSNDL
ncbi:MAG: glycosyltransferase [Lachnospiraceae bacterium]|nr:glycosyltransferase [Lachnospiraceae bacterium]